SGSRIGYQWERGGAVVHNGAMFYATVAGDYTVTVLDSNTNCAATSEPPVQLTVHARPTVSVTPAGPAAFCGEDSVVLTAVSGSGMQYEWRRGPVHAGTGTSYAATATGNYKVVVTDPVSGCSDS